MRGSDSAETPRRHILARLRRPLVVSLVFLVPLAAPAWASAITLSSSKASVAAPETFNLTATVGQDVGPTPNYIVIYDVTGGGKTGVASCGSGTSCTATLTANWTWNDSPGPRSYKAELTPSGGPALETSSPVTVDVVRADFHLTLEADSAGINVGDSVELTARTSPSVTGSPYWIRIFDADSGLMVKACTSGDTCTVSVSTYWWQNTSPTPRRFNATVSRSTPSSGYIYSTDPLTVDVMQVRFLVNLSATEIAPDANGHKRFHLVASADRSVTAPGYRLIIRRSNNSSVEICSSGTTCEADVPGLGERYQAYVYDPGGGGELSKSYWVSLSDDGIKVLGQDGIDFVDAAALFGGASAVCDALLRVGTHFQRATVSDQYLACTQGGFISAEHALAWVSVVLGTAVVAAVILEQQRNNTAPPEPTPTPGPTATPGPVIDADPVPSPFPPGLGYKDVAQTLKNQNPGLADRLAGTGITVDTATKILAKECQARLAFPDAEMSDCTTLPIFASGADVQAATEWDAFALSFHPEWTRLHYQSKGANTGWYVGEAETPPGTAESCQGQRVSQPFTDCHEFPFWTTSEGGPGQPMPFLRIINSSDNTSQGAKLNGFLTACGLKADTPPNPDRAFLVLPQTKIPVTLPLCNSGT